MMRMRASFPAVRRRTVLLLSLLALINSGVRATSHSRTKEVPGHGNLEKEYQNLYDDTAEKDALESIRALHQQLDDDNDGTIEPSETVDFIKGDLHHTNGDRNSRQTIFHKKDAEITVKDLWVKWRRSEVYNWTCDQVVDWLSQNAELPQYASHFRLYGVNGTHLPKVAVSTSFLSKVVGISSPIHRSKISLKAMDIVLFGPPRDNSNWMKDVVLTSLLVVAVTGLFYAYRQNKKSREHLKKMMLDMDSLANAERTLQQLQETLQQKDSKIESLSSTPSEIPDALEVSRLKEELEILRSELHRAEVELEDKCWMAPPVLQNWLQLTYELESQTYNAKKKAAEEQLELAKDMCERLKRTRRSLVGAFVSTHGRSIDDVDRSILEARTALLDLTKDLTERSQRWRQIEMLCGCSIVNNPGIQMLQTLIRHVGQGRGGHGNRFGLSSRISASPSQDDLHGMDDFDAHSVAASHMTAASSHVSRPASLLSSAVHHNHNASVAGSVSGHVRRRNDFKGMGRESSKESSSCDELEQPRPSGNVLLPGDNGAFMAGSSARSSVNSNHHGTIGASSLHHRPGTPPTSSRSSAALKRSKMMQKSLSQDAGGSIQQHSGTTGSVSAATSSVYVSVSGDGRKISTSVSDSQLQEKAAMPTAPLKASSSSMSSSSSSSGVGLQVAPTNLHLSKPSIVEELDESCSASECGSMNGLDKDKKKKRSFFAFKRKKEKKVEM